MSNPVGSAVPKTRRLGWTALLTLVGLLLAWLIAHWAIERMVRAETGTDVERMSRGESRIGFEFDTRRDLISEGAEGATDVSVDAGVLSASIPDGRANLRMNLRGLWLDATRFDFLTARIQSSAAGELVLIFDEPGELAENAVRIDLQAGWNELTLPLADMPWKSAREVQSELAFVAQPWGGRSGAVGEFRLYFALPEGSTIALDYLRFSERNVVTGVTPVNRPWARIEWIDAAEARSRLQQSRPLRERADMRVGIRLPLYLDTPERVLALRDAARRRDAEVLFWPSWAPLPAQDALPAATVLRGWAPPRWLAIAWLGLLALARWRLRPHGARSQWLELAIGWGPLVALMVGLGLPERADPNLLIMLGGQLAYLLSRIQLRGARWLGDRAGWSRAIQFTVLALLALVFISYGTHFLAPAGTQRFTQYLPFVLIQQALLLGYLLPAAQRIGGSRASFWAAALFALVHAPNFALMLLSAFAGWWWTRQYTDHRGVLPILASHYVLGMAAISCLPPWLLYSAEGSLRFLQVN